MNKSKLLFFSAIALAMASCGNNDKAGANGAAATDSANSATEAYETSINIRYVSMDSISKNYVLAQNIAGQAQTLANNLQTRQAQMQNQLQSQYNQIQQKAQNNGYLSQASYEADLKELEKKGAQFQNQYADLERQASVEIDKLQKELRDSIENYINAYNSVKKYDAILYRDAGLYFNPALDITDEVLAGLNARYTGKATADGAAAAAAGVTPDLKTPSTGITNPVVPTVGN